LVNRPTKTQSQQELNILEQLLGNNHVYYRKQCSQIEKGNQKVAKAIFEFKKIFCIPWLIAGTTLVEILAATSPKLKP